MKKKIEKTCYRLFNTEYNLRWTQLCKTFISQLMQYCEIENNLLDVYRLLKTLKYIIQVNQDKYPELESQCDYLIYLIDLETEITDFKIKDPQLRIKIPKLLKWTESFTDLVEIIEGLIFAINKGKAQQQEVQECFEFIFQVKIGGLSEKKGEIGRRKRKPFFIQ
jgi:hypothetical protein